MYQTPLPPQFERRVLLDRLGRAYLLHSIGFKSIDVTDPDADVLHFTRMLHMVYGRPLRLSERQTVALLVEWIQDQDAHSWTLQDKTAWLNDQGIDLAA